MTGKIKGVDLKLVALVRGSRIKLASEPIDEVCPAGPQFNSTTIYFVHFVVLDLFWMPGASFIGFAAAMAQLSFAPQQQEGF